ncbi:DNA topoisomerase III, putative [Trypanosoma vivax Y486]|uniref:DNA topoisomerase n=1 Tax=Trypanosoma vivax (strain Y486) TaxID=1055687 RepID=F9WKC3_TRYVY|nr:DNA topoisomerase III, putative [Trypanosoma vivax Y486]|eukprot:CCD17943.1 DNA topoisomerase III, putative [Trypanosoma vivax Y486]
MDCDREGENICFEVMSVVQTVNRQIEVCRAHFNALTRRDLFTAVHNLKTPNKALSDAVEARQEIDLGIGAVFSRFQTIKFRDMFRDMPRVLSFGPCQIPTLGFVVRRSWEQRGFVPEEYFTLALHHGQTVFSSCRGSMYDQIAATLVLEAMQESASEKPEAEVTEVVQRPNRRHPSVPLATVVLQKLAATHLRISSEQCMMWAESLYQEGYVSYPRTETDSFSLTDNELLEIAGLQSGNSEVGQYVSAMLGDRQNRFRRPLRCGHDDKAFPQIYPTKLMPSSNDPRMPLYNLIVRHFLACVSPDNVAATTSVNAVFGEEKFTTSGTAVLERGWLEVYPYERWHSTCIPAYKRVERFTPTAVNLERHRTTPPSTLTEANLIALMNKHGIGTDATVAQYIKTVLDRECVKKREGTSLVLTTFGNALASAYEAVGLVSLLQPQLRAQMELAMADIATGKATKEEVVGAAVHLYREIFQKLCGKHREMCNELESHLTTVSQPSSLIGGVSTGAVVRRGLTRCGACNGLMDLVEQSAGERDIWLVRCATCARSHRVPSGRHNQLDPHEQLCVLCGYGVISVRNTEEQTNYTVCVHCFTSPPSGGADMESLAEFRCFQCVADCPLAKGLENISIAQCRSCMGNDMRLRQSQNGVFLSCRGYPSCTFSVNLPRAKRIRPVPEGRCASCSALLLQFEFGGMQTVPGVMEGDHMCVFCDVRFQEYVTVKGRNTQK